MLSVTPIDVELLKIVGHVVKMFESESMKYGISVKVEVEPSFEQLGLRNVRLDPSRLTQVLVNILVSHSSAYPQSCSITAKTGIGQRAEVHEACGRKKNRHQNWWLHGRS